MNANLVAQKELRPLKERKAFLEKSRKKKEEEIKKFIKAIKTGNLEIESIEKELRQLEKEKKDLEGQIEELNIKIRREEGKLIDIDIVQRTYQGFGQVFPNLQPKEQHQFLQLLIKEMAIYRDRVRLSLYEIPEIALSIQNTKGLCEPTNWLLGQDSNLQPSGYKCPRISPGLGLSHHPRQLPDGRVPGASPGLSPEYEPKL